MTGALLERPGSLFSGTDWEEGARPGRPDPERPGACEGTARAPHPGRVTLESLLDRTLAEARASGSAACPACGGPMAARGAGAAGGPEAGGGAECGACRTRLS